LNGYLYWQYIKVGRNYKKNLSVIPLLPEEGMKGRREKNV